MTKSLFLEESYEDRSCVIYTLKDKDHDGYESLYVLYMAANDPTEMKFARECFEGWEHWQMVANATWFKPFINRWRDELELRIRSKALANILEEASDRYSKVRYEANKYLLSSAWKPARDKDSVGRPSKEKIKEEAQKLFEIDQSILLDLERLNTVAN